MNSSTTTSSTTAGANFDHFPSHQLLHNITEPQWLPQHPSCTSTTTDESNTVSSSLDRIERDEEMYFEQLRASSLVYRGPSSLDIGSSSHTDRHLHNSGCYPVVGVPTSSKMMSDILLQFHQEAESIDLLSVNELHDDSSNTDFFRKYQSQFQELLLQHEQQQRRTGTEERHDSNATSKSSIITTTGSSHAPDNCNRIDSADVLLHDNNIHNNAHANCDDVSHSSSMMMMSMNSSATTIMSP